MDGKSRRVFSLAFSYFKILLGAAVYAAGIEWLFKPVDMVSGGITGASMIVNMLTGFPVGTLIIILNIPIFILALRKYGFKFMLSSIVGMLSSSLFIDLFDTVSGSPITADPVLAAVFGGIVTGLGMGLIFSADATSGGVDVIATLMRHRRPHLNFGTFILFLDALIISIYALVFRRYENAMYTVIAVFISSKVIDLTLYGVSQSKLCHIISDSSEEIKQEIVKTLRRGVTEFRGTGAYSGKEKQMLMCVVKRRQIVEIRKIIKRIDQDAFVIVTDARDVFGLGFAELISDKIIN